MASPLPDQSAADHNNTSRISPAPEEPVGAQVENNVPRTPLEREANERIDPRRALVDWMGADLDEIENTASASKDRVKSRRRYVTAFEGLKSAVEIRQPNSVPLPDWATLSIIDVAESLQARIDQILRHQRMDSAITKLLRIIKAQIHEIMRDESTFIKRVRIIAKKLFIRLFGSSRPTNDLLIPNWTPLSARVKLSSVLTV